MFNLILFGPPGCGKGTHSDKLVEKYNFKHLSTGDLLRKEIAAKTPLGTEAKGFIDQGKLVPDAVVINMVSNFIDKNKDAKGILFDGFPRTTAQAVALDAMLKEKALAINQVVLLEVSEDELVKRILNRGKTSNRSDDNDENIIRNRFATYLNETAPVAEHYKKTDKVSTVHGEGTIEEIFALICNTLKL